MPGIGTGYCCSKCKVSYHPLKNDIIVVEMADKFNTEPYRLWCADLLECPICKHRLIAGFGQSAWGIHHAENFQEQLEKAIKTGLLFTVSGHRYELTSWDKDTNTLSGKYAAPRVR